MSAFASETKGISIISGLVGTNESGKVGLIVFAEEDKTGIAKEFIVVVAVEVFSFPVSTIIADDDDGADDDNGAEEDIIESLSADCIIFYVFFSEVSFVFFLGFFFESTC